ncbi:hypothetical protein FNJ84_08885 [Paracoccus sp. M683]|uniref:hypothetical protein n=1 Tax=Paracoccus sp. M683 TaxID=2594268 RepID=UPI00117F68BA|nr:hypothetical protein [Paracoccus sp. M683]TRW97607.1 hypothetical protein FNJ84_08885 [Paracoccus sp. M683]
MIVTFQRETVAAQRAAQGVTRRQFALGSAAAMAILAAAAGRAWGQEPLPRLRIVESGHSLTDGVMEPLRDMINAAGGRGTTLVKSTIPGSPMEWRWEHPAEPNLRDPAAMAQFDLMVITERVSLSNTLPFHRSEEMGLRWFEQAWTYGKDGQGAATILYATWVDIDSGPDHENPYKDSDGKIPFRQRMDREMVLWEQIANHVNKNRPEGSPAMKVIPGPLIMAAAYDAIAAGEAPGLTEMQQLFEDVIHPNELGKYLIALAHFAVIYNRDPHGLPAGVPARGGTSPEQAAWMQDLVWRVVSGYPGAMTDGSGQLDY